MVITNNADGGTNGAIVATSDTGSGTSWTGVAVDVNRVTYSNETVAHGNLSYRFEKSPTVGLSLAWNTTIVGTTTEHYGRMYIYMTGAPSISNKLVRGASGGQSFSINYGSTDKIFIKNNIDTTIWQSTTVIAPYTWVRLEWHIVHNGAIGTVEVRIYVKPDDNTHTESSGNVVGDYLSNTNYITFGPSNAGGTMPLMYMDDMAFGDAAGGWLGPAYPNTAALWAISS